MNPDTLRQAARFDAHADEVEASPPGRQQSGTESKAGVESNIRALADANPAPIVGLDAAGNIQLWNNAAEARFGWTEADLIGKPPPVRSNAPSDGCPVSLASHLQKDRPDDVVLCWHTKTGEDVELLARVREWLDADSMQRGVLLTLIDISARKQAQMERESLIRSETRARQEASASLRFRELLEAAPDAIIEVDQNGKILLMNAVTETLFGYTREELLGQPVEILVPGGDRAQHGAHRTSYWNHPITRPMGRGLTLHARRKDGSEFPVEISLSPVHSEQGLRVATIVRDVTARKRIEDEMRRIEQRYTAQLAETNLELERRNREIENADRLKSEFLASMSHELRTPLHTIIGFSELLAEEIQGPLNGKQKRFVEHIRRDSRHLLELINDILDLSKIESGRVQLRLEPFQANAAVEEVVTSVHPSAAAKSIQLASRMEGGFLLNADRVRFKEVLYNLLSNAVKFTESGGSIVISAEHVNEDADTQFARFDVTDTGIGIPPEQQTAIFDKFYQVGSTTKGVREGTGLGLAITRHIVEMHGGHIGVESEVGKGSRFHFMMPLAHK